MGLHNYIIIIFRRANTQSKRHQSAVDCNGSLAVPDCQGGSERSKDCSSGGRRLQKNLLCKFSLQSASITLAVFVKTLRVCVFVCVCVSVSVCVFACVCVFDFVSCWDKNIEKSSDIDLNICNRMICPVFWFTFIFKF